MKFLFSFIIKYLNAIKKLITNVTFRLLKNSGQLTQKNSWLQPNNFNGRRKLETLEASQSTLSAELIESKAFHSIWESYLSQITSFHPSIFVVSDLFRCTDNLNGTYPLSSEAYYEA